MFLQMLWCLSCRKNMPATDRTVSDYFSGKKMIYINRLITLLTKQQNNFLLGYIKQCISNTFLLIKTIEKPEKAVAFYLTFAREKDTKWWISDLGITPIKHTSLFYGNTWLNIYQFNRWTWYTGTRELRIGNFFGLSTLHSNVPNSQLIYSTS